MNCDRCPHMEAIIKAMKPCQLCEAGKLHGQVSTDAAANADLVYAHRQISDHTPSAGITSLEPDAEDALRRAMATMFDLDPIELLLVQNVIKGRSYAEFRFTLAALNARLRTKERELNSDDSQGFRQLAHMWSRKVSAKMPQMRDVLRGRIEFD